LKNLIIRGARAENTAGDEKELLYFLEKQKRLTNRVYERTKLKDNLLSDLLRRADVIDMPKRASLTMLNVSFMRSEWCFQEQEIYKKKPGINYNKITTQN